MNILILGSGGREHALARKISQDNQIDGNTYVFPGNAGMMNEATFQVVGLDQKLNIENLAAILKEIGPIDLIIPGPEGVIVSGVKNQFESESRNVFSPSKEASILESSKIFSKKFCSEQGIPSAKGYECDNFQHALAIINEYFEGLPCVIKLDGLAAGKGVFVCSNTGEALDVLREVYQQEGVKKKILIESFLQGRELSVFFLCDGQNYKYIGHARDHKRLLEGDKGPNTGGMGCVTEYGDLDDSLFKKVCEKILEPTLAGMIKMGTPYSGFLFLGLMIKEGEPSLIEYNVRMGDPETQTILPNLKINLLDEINSIKEKNKSQCNNDIFNQDTAIHVVMTSENYALAKKEMLLNQSIEIKDSFDCENLFYAGVKPDPKEKGKLLNSGGRVLGITELGMSLESVREKCYQKLSKIGFKGCYYRRDIGE